MKIFGLNVFTDVELRDVKHKSHSEGYRSGIEDVKVLLENKERHEFFFSPVTIVTGNKLKLKNAAFLGGGTTNFGCDVTIEGMTILKSGAICTK